MSKGQLINECPACGGRGSRDRDNEIARRTSNLNNWAKRLEYDDATIGSRLREVWDKVDAIDLTCNRCLGTRMVPTALGEEVARLLSWLNNGGYEVIKKEQQRSYGTIDAIST